MLMPPTLVRSIVERFGPTGRALSELARRADVSASAALYTLAEETQAPVLYAVCGVGRSASRELQVRVSAASASFPYSLSSGTVMPAGHPVQEAYASGLPVEAVSHLPFRSGRRMPAYVTAYPVGGLVTAAFALGKGQQQRLVGEETGGGLVRSGKEGTTVTQAPGPMSEVHGSGTFDAGTAVASEPEAPGAAGE